MFTTFDTRLGDVYLREKGDAESLPSLSGFATQFKLA